MKNGALFGVFIIEGTAKGAKQGGQRAVEAESGCLWGILMMNLSQL